MKKSLPIFCFSAMVMLLSGKAMAGNPDRQGEAGAPELLMNPWARSSGLHTMTTSLISGVEAMQLNVAGLARLGRTEVVVGHTQYLRGTDVNINALGFAQKIGKSSAFGISLMSLDFGDIPITTTSQPEGNGGTFAPRFFNIGLGFSHVFENKVSVGVLARAVSESIQDANATAVCLDAGVQYVTGAQDQFKFGISIRNIGGRMQYRGEGLSDDILVPAFDGDHGLTVLQRSTTFELQSVLNIGLSYDFLLGSNNRLTAIANYTSNAFSEDQVGAGLEFSLRDRFMLRGGYRVDFGQVSANSDQEPLYTGLCGGVTINVPVSKKALAPQFAIDYSYQATKVFDGTHSISIRINLFGSKTDEPTN